MKRPCYCVRHRRILLGLALVPPLLWVALLAVLPTQFARTKIAERLSASSGRIVKIGALKVGFMGGVRLKDLQIGAPTTGGNPWLSVHSARIDLHLYQLFLGPIEPANIDVEGMELRILRRSDGSMELADFLNPADPRVVTSSFDEPHEKHCVNVAIHNAKVNIIDEPSATTLLVEHVEGNVTCDGIVTTVSNLSGKFNSGTVQFAGRFDRSGALPKFEGQIRTRDVSVGEGMGALGYFLPLLPVGKADSRSKLEGRLALDFYLEGQGTSRQSLRRSLVGQGRVDVDPISLDGSSTLKDLAKLLQVPSRERFGAARADLAFKNGRMTSENLTLNIAKVPLIFTGWTDMDGVVSYRLKTEAITDKIPRDALQFINELDIDLKEIADLQVLGTTNDPKVVVDGQPLSSSKSGSDDGNRLREIGRRLRDRVRR